MTDPYAYDTYAGREGETFRIVLDDEAVDATLTSVTRPSGEGRSGFSLTFLAPGEVLPQRIYVFDHDDLGLLELFVVPIGRDERGVTYEAIFN